MYDCAGAGRLVAGIGLVMAMSLISHRLILLKFEPTVSKSKGSPILDTVPSITRMSLKIAVQIDTHAV
jgi:hypothetical protein